MAATTGIAWTEATFNPWIGCERVSPACDHCYAETLDKRAGGFGDKAHPDELHWGKDAPRKSMSESYWHQPLKWNRNAALRGLPMLVFCASLADVYEERNDLEPIRTRLFELIEKTPWLIWQLLTKRPGNIIGDSPARWTLPPDHHPSLPDQRTRPGYWPTNVWIGTTTEDQPHYNVRVKRLREVPSPTRFLSVEPMLGPIDFGDLSGIHWVIVGGESGPGWRPMDPAWVRSTIGQCREQSVPVFYKQPSELRPEHNQPFEGQMYQEFPASRFVTPTLFTALDTAEPGVPVTIATRP